MTRKLVSARIWAAKRVETAADRRDRGQGTLEYVGMVVAVAVVIGAVVTAINAWNLPSHMTTIISDVFK
ncbi:hypothetical protein KIH74_27080 [Kineosporia sp. J2-2]|uniref:Flp family type IVb pilin n=1 Tax=Kineosporia corallincola TaxID=2835133 RepID=A0ABS5TNG0_9ACTN|nr:hypothetical protein [Kineosporia corallincola]MBT0772637.1 hypothetical protein [Kineosporia corallincola]